MKRQNAKHAMHTKHTRANPIGVGFAVAVVSFAGASPTFGAEAHTPPNIIFILADDLGYGDLGAYGQKKIKTPHLDRMASEGMRFTQAYAGSTVCAPSRSSLMTGQHTGHTYIRGNAKVDLRPEDVTVAEVLRSAGYATALFGKWGLGHEGSAGVPTKQGFDHFFGYLDQTHAHNSYPTFLMRNEQRVRLKNEVPKEGPVGQGVASRKLEFSQDLIMNEAMSWLAGSAKGERPFFMYLTPTLPHANNEGKIVEVPSQGEYAKHAWSEAHKNQAAAITRLDADVGRVLTALRTAGLERRTIVIVSSDNGPHREGGNDPDFFDANGPLRGLKRDLYEGGIRVPAIAWGPGVVKARTVSQHPWAFWDVMATLAELAGASDKVPAGTDGLSFAPALRGKKAPVHDAFYWEFHEKVAPARALRSGAWKLVEKGGRGATLELYDLSKDVGEKANVAAKHPEVVRRLLADMNRARTDNPHWSLAQAAPRRTPDGEEP